MLFRSLLLIVLSWQISSAFLVSHPSSKSSLYRIPSSSQIPPIRSARRSSLLHQAYKNDDSENTSTNDYYKHKKRKRRQNKEWLLQATDHLLATPPGSLDKGKWHEVVSILTAWSAYVKNDYQAPLQMEALLKRLLDERRHSNNSDCHVTIEQYNQVLDAWACAALFRTQGRSASQRAREILVLLQENYESTNNTILRPNEESFDVVLHVVGKREGALLARRLLAWMEYLYKSGKNVAAQPTRTDYIMVLDAYANSRKDNAGLLAEGFLRHMNMTGVPLDALCYNIAIKAWNKAKRGRESAVHADRILESMQAEPDVVTYASVISAWATSGMKAHAVSRAEELLQEMKVAGLEPNTVVLNAVMSAWVKSRNPAAVDRTHEILQELENSCSDRLTPDLISYNTHLHALSIHARRSGYAQRADELLQRMETLHAKGSVNFCPNLFSYNLVIEAYCRSPDPNAAMRAADVLRKLVKRDGVEPDTFSFNQVLLALSRSSMKGAARMAEELLLYMEDAYRTGVHPKARPDIIGYTSVIVAYTRSSEQGGAERAEELLDQIKARCAAGEHQLRPNRICYNSLIDGWAKSGEGTLGARKAEALLQEMQNLYEAGDESMKPNLITWNGVLNAWARSGTRCCGVQAEKYLDRMWELYHAGDDKVKPNDFSYNTVINAISKSKNEGKAQKALRILRRMDKLYQAGNKEARPNEVTYTAVLNSCAFPAVLDSRTRRKALDTAIFTLEELQSSRYGHPNQVTYGTFIKACANLLDDDDELRREVIERAFQQCCKDGQVGEMVLTYLRKAAPPDLYEELLADIMDISSGRKISVEDLPLEWRCNVRHKDRWRDRPYSNKVRASQQQQQRQRSRSPKRRER